MKTALFSLLLIITPLSVAQPKKECVSRNQMKALENQVKGLEVKLKDVLHREITARLENEDSSTEKENARQLYFKLRKARAELEAAQGNFCQEKK